jgi:hypothetical protein
MSQPPSILARRRPWVALIAALLAGGVAAARVGDIEPHLTSEVRLLSGSSGQSMWQVDLRARGGGEVLDVSADVSDPLVTISDPTVAVLKSGETKPLRIMVDASSARGLSIEVSYRNPAPQTLHVERPGR